jgi:tryptophan halogenase
MGIDKLLHLWPDQPLTAELTAPLADEYNRLSVVEFERIRDFIILHYSANGRLKGKFWRHCREMALPETLARKIAIYRARGLIQQFDCESFFDPSWLCMYGNFGIDASSWDPLTNLLPLPELEDVTRRVRDDIVRVARGATPHREFLRLAGAFAGM